MRVATDVGKSWDENPMGVSGILIPPPCPKEIGGKGLVPDPVIHDPGNGYVKPPENPDEIQYPVITRIKDVIADPPDGVKVVAALLPAVLNVATIFKIKINNIRFKRIQSI